jgi:hypothetical protein
MYLPSDSSEADRRCIRDEFAKIGGGLTKTDWRAGEGEWHPAHRPPVNVPTERFEGIGPCTSQALALFCRVLAMARRLLGQECVLGYVIPAGLCVEIWDGLGKSSVP